MVFQERTYSVLVASAAEKLNDVLRQMLPVSDYYPVTFTASAAAARRELAQRDYDFVIINAPLPDEFGSRFACDVVSRPGAVALLLVRGELYEEISAKVTAQGVFTLSKPIPSLLLQQSLKWMACARERLRGLERKAGTIEEKMEEIRLVNRAKWLLIENLSMTENDAHRHIEKQAMDRCVSRREIALGIIQTYG